MFEIWWFLYGFGWRLFLCCHSWVYLNSYSCSSWLFPKLRKDGLSSTGSSSAVKLIYELSWILACGSSPLLIFLWSGYSGVFSRSSDISAIELLFWSNILWALFDFPGEGLDTTLRIFFVLVFTDFSYSCSSFATWPKFLEDVASFFLNSKCSWITFGMVFLEPVLAFELIVF